MLISIVICTHNRSNLLAIALDSLSLQDAPFTDCELIVVDNCSTDDTRTIVQSFQERQPLLRYVYEEKMGLSYARNRGWHEAQGEYVGFLDDDCKIPPEWLRVAAEIASQKSPAAFGGPYFAFYNTSKPKWFRDEYGSHDQGLNARPLGKHEFLDGGNLFIRRSLLQKFGGFNPDFGMKGDNLAYGEETGLLESIRHQKYDNILYYEPRLFIKHLVRAEKMTWPWIIRHRIASGRDYYHISKDARNLSTSRMFLRIIMNLGLLPIDFLIGTLIRDKKKYPFKENYIYEHTLTYFMNLIDLWEVIKGSFGSD